MLTRHQAEPLPFNDAARKFWNSDVYAGEFARDSKGGGRYRITRMTLKLAHYPRTRLVDFPFVDG